MPCIVTPPAKRQVKEVLTGKIGPRIANVYAGLKGTNRAPCYYPPYQRDRRVQIARNGNHELLANPKQLARPGRDLQPTERKQVDRDLVLK